MNDPSEDVPGKVEKKLDELEEQLDELDETLRDQGRDVRTVETQGREGSSGSDDETAEEQQTPTHEP